MHIYMYVYVFTCVYMIFSAQSFEAHKPRNVIPCYGTLFYALFVCARVGIFTCMHLYVYSSRLRFPSLGDTLPY